MARKTKEEKRVEKLLDAAYKKHGNGVSVPMMSLTAIFDAGEAAAKAGKTDAEVEEAVRLAIEKVRVN